MAKTEHKTYMEAIAFLAEEKLRYEEFITAPAVMTIAFIYGKTEDSVWTSLQVKLFQLNVLKTLKQEKRS